jgi:hypothetical protein
MLRLDCEAVSLDTEDGGHIDGMLVYTLNHTQETPTIIFCNPNAGYYEFIYYQSEWVHFYTSLGCNVLVWNYR